MIGAIELLGAFQGNNITDILHHADSILLAHRVGTNGANIRIGYIVAALAKLDFAAHTGHHITEMLYVFRFLLQQMKHQTKGCFTTDSGQLGKLVYGIFQ